MESLHTLSSLTDNSNNVDNKNIVLPFVPTLFAFVALGLVSSVLSQEERKLGGTSASRNENGQMDV